MRLLLTRAPEDAARTRSKLEAMGHEVMLAPVIRIVPLPARWPVGVVDAVVASSAHAFAAWADGPPAPELRRLVRLLLVGARTLACARDCGFSGEAVAAADAAGLANVIGATERSMRAVYLAGRDRKPDIERALGASSVRVEVVESYAAEPVKALPDDAARFAAGAGVLHFSRRSAELFLALAIPAGLAAETLTHICLSNDAASPLRDAGCRDVTVAVTPDEAALLALLPPIDR